MQNFILANNSNLLAQVGKLINFNWTHVPLICTLLMRTEWPEERDKDKHIGSLSHEKLITYTICLFFSLVFFCNCCKSVICYMWTSGSPASHTDLLIETQPPNNQEPELVPALFLHMHLNSNSDLCLSYTNSVEDPDFHWHLCLACKVISKKLHLFNPPAV